MKGKVEKKESREKESRAAVQGEGGQASESQERQAVRGAEGRGAEE